MSFSEPIVSVIIPSYNHEKYVATAIESVLAQTFSDFELVIIDDASTDSSQEIIRKFDDRRIRFYPMEKNGGAVHTLNLLYTYAKGKYVALLNSDDFWEHNKLEKQVKFLEKHNDYGMIFSSARLVTEKSTPEHIEEIPDTLFDQVNLTQGGWFRKLFVQVSFLCHPSMMIRRELYDYDHGYLYAMRQCPDLEMHIRNLKKANLYVLPERLVNLRIMEDRSNASAVTYSNLVRSETEVMLIMENFFEGMTDEVFLEGFSDLCISKSPRNHDQIRCEQAFLYFKVENEFSRAYELVGLKKLFSLINEKNTRNILEKVYSFSFHDYFQLVEKKGIKNFANTWLSGTEGSITHQDVNILHAPSDIIHDRDSMVKNISIFRFVYLKIKLKLKRYPRLYRMLKKIFKSNIINKR